MNVESPIATPVALTIQDTSRRYGWTRSWIYLQLAAGNLEARKAGRRTLIIRESCDRLLDALPKGTYRAPATCGAP